MTTEERLKEELALLKEIEETKIQIRKTKSVMRKEQLGRHLASWRTSGGKTSDD